MIEKEMRKLFSIPDAKETRLWNRYMTNTFEPLNKPDSTIQDAGLYQGQVMMFQTFTSQFSLEKAVNEGQLSCLSSVKIHPSFTKPDQT